MELDSSQPSKTIFSLQDGYDFANMSSIVYKTKEEAKSLLQGDEGTNGFGFDCFHWFEVQQS